MTRTVDGHERTLLVVSAGVEAVPGIEHARELGLHVVASDGNPDAPGFAVADDRLHASTYDVAATVAAARRYDSEVRHIDGVISIASDVPLTVATVAVELGLPGVSLETIRLSSDKLMLKQRLLEHGIATASFAEVPEAADLAAYATTHGYPLVVKPPDSRGARGVLLLRDARTELEWAHATARRESPTGRVLVERFLEGPQISTESLVVDGVVHTVGVADRNYEHLERFAPYVIENGGEIPSRLDADARALVDELLQRVADALCLRAGVLKGDLVMCEGVPHLIELALRLSGGYFCTHQIPLGTGVDLVAQAIRVALGETPDATELRATRNLGAAQRWLFPAPGRVTRIAGVEKVAARAEVALCEVRVREGELVHETSSHGARVGVVLAAGPTREQAIDRAQQAVGEIEIETSR
jgi:biotin carboxylase